MLETLFAYGEDANKSQLTSEMFYKNSGTANRSNSDFTHSHDEALLKAMFAVAAVAVASRKYLYYHFHWPADGYFSSPFTKTTPV